MNKTELLCRYFSFNHEQATVLSIACYVCLYILAIAYIGTSLIAGWYTLNDIALGTIYDAVLFSNVAFGVGLLIPVLLLSVFDFNKQFIYIWMVLSPLVAICILPLAICIGIPLYIIYKISKSLNSITITECKRDNK